MKSKTNKIRLFFMLVCAALISTSCSDGGGGTPPGSNELNPEITAVNPTSGMEGTAVTITGTDFSPTASANTVSFNGTSAQISSASSTQIETSVPAGATSGEVTVSVDGNRASGPSFTVEVITPEITSVSPDTVYVGNEIMIRGTNFSNTPAENTLQISGIPVTVTEASDTLLVAQAPNPEEDMDEIEITLTVNGQSATFDNFYILRIVAITGGFLHSCGLTMEGNAYCWGNNEEGQLGNNSRTNSRVPVAVNMPAGVRFTQISAGLEQTIALDESGQAWGWGKNDDGQLGDGTEMNRLTPAMADQPGGVTFAQVSAGSVHTLALDTDGQAWAWGLNSLGSLGDGSGSGQRRFSPVMVAQPEGVIFTVVRSGNSYSLAIDDDGNGWGWGSNSFAQLGNGQITRQRTPVMVSMPDGVSFTQITGGVRHTIALSSTGEAWSWGDNRQGQIGREGAGNGVFRTPVEVTMPAGVSFTNIGAGNFHVLAVDESGQGWAWGSNSSDRLGTGSSNSSERTPTMIAMPTGVSFSLLNAGSRHSLAISANGTPYAWGANGDGQLGFETSGPDQPVPAIIIFSN